MNIFGSSGNDVLEGSIYADFMVGYAGNDTMNGGGGNDQIYAGSGNDVLIGGKGQDVLKGEAGADIFQFSMGDGTGQGDRILDFTDGDRISFVGVSQRTVSQNINAEGDLEIYYGVLGSPTSMSSKITLANVDHYLGFGDFMFA
jgi:Ca2+-binding RTX toxin-like protein